MKLLKAKILIVFLSSLFITPTYSDVVSQEIEKNETPEIVNEKTFPEKFDVLIKAPNKSDEIVIPMSKKEYQIRIVEELQKGWSKQKDKIEKSLLDVESNNDIVLVKFNTKVEENYISVHDDSTELNFSYYFANGYILETHIYKYINDEEYENGAVEFLYDKFEKYLIKKGFVKSNSIKDKFNDIVFQTKKYTLNNYIVTISKDFNLVGYNFLVTMQNKEINDNIEKIEADITKANLEYKYENLNKILE